MKVEKDIKAEWTSAAARGCVEAESGGLAMLRIAGSTARADRAEHDLAINRRRAFEARRRKRSSNRELVCIVCESISITCVS